MLLLSVAGKVIQLLHVCNTVQHFEAYKWHCLNQYTVIYCILWSAYKYIMNCQNAANSIIGWKLSQARDLHTVDPANEASDDPDSSFSSAVLHLYLVELRLGLIRRDEIVQTQYHLELKNHWVLLSPV